MTPEEENEKNTKSCQVDGKTPCVQYPDEDECDCNPCEDCQVSVTYTDNLRQIVKRMLAVKEASDSGKPLVSCQGQAMDGYSELANYRSILEGVEI